MKPDWDKVMEAYKDSETVLVADVDCTGQGKPLCTDAGVKSYPTIKYGDPHNLADYTGGRDFEALKDFADTLGPTCSPGKLYLCDEEKTEKINKFMAMSVSELEAAINEKNAEIEKIEADFKLSYEPKQQKWQQKKKEKDEAVEEIKASGFAFMKAVQAAQGGPQGSTKASKNKKRRKKKASKPEL